MINIPYKKRVPNGTKSPTVGCFGYLAVSILLIIGLIIGLGGCSNESKNVYVAGYNDDAVAVFNRNTENGTLTFSQTLKNTDPGVDGLDGASSVAVSRYGNNVYAAGLNDAAVAVFNRNTENGMLTFSKTFKNTDPGVDGLDGARSVTVSPDGKNVYAAGYFDDAVVVFDRE